MSLFAQISFVNGINQTHHSERPSIFVHDGIDLEILEQTRGIVGDRRHIATLDLHLVTAVAVFLVHAELMPGMLYTPTIEGIITWGASSLAYSALHIPLPSSACSMAYLMSWELWARPPVLTPVPWRRTHSSQRPQRLHYSFSSPWCLLFRDFRQSKDTQHKVHLTSKSILAHATTRKWRLQNSSKKNTTPLKFPTTPGPTISDHFQTQNFRSWSMNTIHRTCIPSGSLVTNPWIQPVTIQHECSHIFL